jgi:hypothetical protein
LFDLTFQPNGANSQVLEAGFHRLIGDLYRSDRVKARRRRFWNAFRSGAATKDPRKVLGKEVSMGLEI